MFKIRDRVTVTDVNSTYFRKEGEITRKWFSPILFQVQFDDGAVHNFPAESLALVSAFTAGDRVIVTNANDPYFGLEGEIIATGGGSAQSPHKVRLDDGNLLYFSSQDIARACGSFLAKGGIIHVFTVGDRVVVTNRQDSYYKWEGEIKAITNTQLCEVEFVKGPVTITHVYSHQNLAPAPTSHSKKPEPEICPQCHDGKSYDGGSILDITKRMF